VQQIRGKFFDSQSADKEKQFDGGDRDDEEEVNSYSWTVRQVYSYL